MSWIADWTLSELALLDHITREQENLSLFHLILLLSQGAVPSSFQLHHQGSGLSYLQLEKLGQEASHIISSYHQLARCLSQLIAFQGPQSLYLKEVTAESLRPLHFEMQE